MRLSIVLTCVFFIIVGCTNLSNQIVDSKSDYNMSEIESGRKLVLIMGCNDCHTSDAFGGGYGPEENWLVGGTRGFYGSYGTVYPANLRLLISEITEEEWVRLALQMRQDSPMAWSRLPSLSVDDLRAIYNFIKYLGPKGTPAPSRLPPGVKPTTKFISFPLPH